ncbi:MAG: hypothetical protein JO147_12565 [Actinobacteria bacterium]|nr:hypothetical protein [Actinomycetota bacterium]
MASSPAHCSFCGARTGRLVALPVLPKRLDKKFQRDAEARDPENAGFACRPCVTGWMRRLDEDAAPAVRDLADGEAPPMTDGEWSLLRLWCLRLAVVLGSAADDLPRRVRAAAIVRPVRAPTQPSVWLLPVVPNEKRLLRGSLAPAVATIQVGAFAAVVAPASAAATLGPPPGIGPLSFDRTAPRERADIPALHDEVIAAIRLRD